MFKIIAFLLMTNIAIAADLPDTVSGEVIESSFFNKITQTINKIIDIQIPTGENNYSARIVGVSITNQNVSWLSSCSYPSAGRYNCVVNPSLGLTQKMNCSVTLDQSSLSACIGLIDTANSSVSNILVQGQETARNAYCGMASFVLACQRGGVDYKPYKSIRQILISAGLSFLE